MVVTFSVDIKSVREVRNTSPSTPPKEALLTLVGVYMEPNCIASLVTSETCIVGILVFFSIVFSSISSLGRAS